MLRRIRTLRMIIHFYVIVHCSVTIWFLYCRPCGKKNKISLGGCGRFTVAEFFSFGVSLMIVFIWIITGHWLLMDAMGIGLCVAFIAFVRLPSLKVSTLLLSGLLLYDVFWVFFSKYVFSANVMVRVGKAFLRLNFSNIRSDRNVFSHQTGQQSYGSRGQAIPSQSCCQKCTQIVFTRQIGISFKSQRRPFFYVGSGRYCHAWLTALFRNEIRCLQESTSKSCNGYYNCNVSYRKIINGITSFFLHRQEKWLKLVFLYQILGTESPIFIVLCLVTS